MLATKVLHSCCGVPLGFIFTVLQLMYMDLGFSLRVKCTSSYAIATPRYHVDGRFEFNCLIGKWITSLPCIKCGLISRTSNCGKQKPRLFPKKEKYFVKNRNIYWVVYPTVHQVFVMDSADIRLHDPITHWIICRRETFLAPPPKKLSYCSRM